MNLELTSMKWDSFEDFKKKYDSRVNPENYATRQAVYTLCDYIGYQYKTGLIDFDAVYKQRKMIKFEDTGIPVVPIKELIRMKEKSNRPQDQADVFYLKKIVGDWEDEK